jgi:hypothetical protein
MNRKRTLIQRVTSTAEFNIGVFAFLVNYPWEFLQVPFFDHMPQADHWQAIVTCTRATLGDAMIMLIAFAAVAILWRDRRWVRDPTPKQIAVFVGIGVLVTIGLEWHATEITRRWSYAPTMPVLPPLGTGLMPILQWLLLPPLVLWFVRRQIIGSERL